jgi:ssDNA-binding Zn-finger/Zn-ribbon topoisomerase 1
MKKRKVTLERTLDAVNSGESIGICRACGHEQDGVEPDARRYACDNCNACQVYGAEELLLTFG